MLVLQSDIEENIKRENSCDKKFDTPDRAVRVKRDIYAIVVIGKRGIKNATRR